MPALSFDLPHPLASAAASDPERLLLSAADGAWTAAALCEEVRLLAGWLASEGIRPGMRVALCGPARGLWVLGFHALGWLGASVAPLPAPGPRLPLADWRARWEAVEASALLRIGGEAAGAPAASAQTLDLSGRPVGLTELAPERFWRLAEERLVVASSGSSGAPKAIALATGQLVFSAYGSAARLGLDPADRWLGCLPLHHIGGLSVLTRSLIYGTCAELHEGFDAARVAERLDSGDVSLVSLVPQMLEDVLDARPASPFPARLRAILLGGAACSPALRARCEALGLPVSLTWGSTETASQVATCAPGDLRAGAPSLNVARVEAREVAGRERLVVRGPLVGGELVTEDRGRLVGGRVEVLGRCTDVIVSGGENVSLAEVEAALLAHPRVREAAVVALPDARWGARPGAFVVGEVTVAELEAWCAERLERVKRPERIERLEALPKSALGKILKAALAARLVDAAQPASREEE